MISILVIYCCVTNYPQVYYLTQTFIILTPKCFSELGVQEGLSLDSSCWGGGSIYHEVQTRYQLQSSGGLTEAGRSDSDVVQEALGPCWLLGGGLISSPHGPLHMTS